jgi:hypothetical protein
MIPVEDAETLHAEAKALRAEVREVVSILENWNADRHRNHAVRGGATPPGGIRQGGFNRGERTMAEIDFGKLVSRVLARMDDTESNLTGGESRDTGKALQHYKQALVEEIRAAFDEADVPGPAAPEPVPCTRCGAILEGERRFCTVCGMPQKKEAPGDSLERMLAKDAGTAPDDPHFRASIARIREEQPEAWDALVQLIAAPVKA